MKRILSCLNVLLLLICLGSCGPRDSARIAATTLPVYEFTTRLCAGTDLTVARLVTESVSCLHDYSLNVFQVRAIEEAELIVINGVELESFMEDLLTDRPVIDSSVGITIKECHDEPEHQDEHDHHHHDVDNHIWLSVKNAMIMAQNICDGLTQHYPGYSDVFRANLTALLKDMEDLQLYGQDQLSDLTNRELITFHDGFSYLAESYDLHILEAVEEESGSEASAAELKHLIKLVRSHQLPAIFTEVHGSGSAASIIARETGIPSYPLDMAMSGNSWFDAMYHNIDTLKEALG